MIGPVALLEFENEMRVLRARFVVEIFRETQEQDVAQEIEDGFLDRRVAAFRRGDGALDHCAVLVADRLPRA